MSCLLLSPGQGQVRFGFIKRNEFGIGFIEKVPCLIGQMPSALFVHTDENNLVFIPVNRCYHVFCRLQRDLMLG
jgi:hypothetical protein